MRGCKINWSFKYLFSNISGFGGLFSTPGNGHHEDQGPPHPTITTIVKNCQELPTLDTLEEVKTQFSRALRQSDVFSVW